MTRTSHSYNYKAVFIKLRHFTDFEIGLCIITAILDIELVIFKKHTKYFTLKDVLKLEEMQAFHCIESSNTKDGNRIPFSFFSEEG